MFKINKGIDSVADNQAVNKYTPEKERPIPFKRMIYFGDGDTDILCMQLVKKQGGHSIAVYNPENTQKKATAEKLIAEERVNFICAADYGKDGSCFEW